MAAYQSWTRLEPRTRDRAMERALEARIHDPLWMLARQWQVGELQGEDAGSPVRVEVESRAEQLSRLFPTWPARRWQAARQPFDPAGGLLEAAAEGEPAVASAPAELQARLALELLRALPAARREAYRAALRQAYPLDRDPVPDEAGRAFVAAVSRRTFHAGRLLADLERGRGPAALAPGDEAAFEAWAAWCRGLWSEPQRGGTWRAERLEYAFAASSPDLDGAGRSDRQQVVTARAYHGGRLDWPAFDRGPVVAVAGDPQERAAPRRDPLLATPVRFPGMPASRWWELEDGRVSLGAVEAGPEDLGRLLLVEFALVYGNDFFLVPIPLAAGSLCRVDALRVTDTFGKVTEVPPASALEPGAPWRMFSLTPDPALGGGASPDLLFLAPAVGPCLEGPALEEVQLVRDEMANLVFAVEHAVEGATGTALDRHELHQELRRARVAPARAPSQGAGLAYRLEANTPPAHWIPLVPRPAGGRVLLEVAPLLRPDAAGGSAPVADEFGNPIEPWGKLLAGAPAIAAEEVPRDGLWLRRAWQVARSPDGRRHAWVGRRREPGGGEGSSGLRFDVTVARTGG